MRNFRSRLWVICQPAYQASSCLSLASKWVAMGWSVMASLSMPAILNNLHFWRGLSVLRDMSRTVEGYPSSAELCQIASQKELVNNPWRHLWLSPSAKGHVLAQLILWRSHTALCAFSQFHQELGFFGLAPQIACIAHATDTSSMQHRTVCSCGNSAAGAKSWRLEDREGRLVHVN